MKKIFKVLTVAVAAVVLALCFSACGGNKRESEFISVTFSPHPYTGQTKYTYYSGESFSKADTCVGLKYYVKEENTEYTHNFSLGNPPSHISYEVSGFDSSVPVESQTITVKFTSSKIPGEITGTFNIKILPPLLTEVKLKDESMIKSTYVVGEELNYDNIVLQAVYGNGTKEDVPVTADMVSGFNTTAVSANNKTLTITYNNEALKFHYNVAPAGNYERFNESYMKCFVPTQESGYTKKTTADDTVLWTNDGVASIEIGCYQRTTITQSLIENRFSTGVGLKSNVTVTSYGTKNITPNLSGIVCKFTRTGSAANYTVVYFDNSSTITSGLVSQTQYVTVEILFTDYAKTDETAEMIKTIMGSIVK